MAQIEASAPGQPTGRVANDGAVMSLTDHLGELRNRLIWAVAAVAVMGVIGFVISDQIIAMLSSPLPPDVMPLRFTSLGDPLAIRLRIAVITGIILAMPILLYHLWRFIAPGLTANERKMVRPWIPVALLLFAIGVGIAFTVLPYAASFLLSFSTPDLEALLTARDYFDFVSTMFLAFGLMMEFPIVLYALSRIGIATSERLKRARRYAILVIAVFAAAATPGGDLVSPVVLGLTMYVLYEGTLQVIARTGR